MPTTAALPTDSYSPECKEIYEWGGNGEKTNPTRIILAAGYGTTATHALFQYYGDKGLRTVHWKQTLNLSTKEKAAWLALHSQLSSLSPHDLSNFDFRVLHQIADVFIDEPIPDLIAHLYRAYPNALVILTHRDPLQWAEKRQQEHHNSPTPFANYFTSISNIEKNRFDKKTMLLQPKVNTWSIASLMYSLHITMVRCLVKKGDLVEIDYFKDDPKDIENKLLTAAYLKNESVTEIQ